ncbi:YtxH domain-containing protein [Nitrospira moscoviensis]|uniref:YtxH domain-containing protein n=1 Tax=Nitrospira moscoviensis TaxID=42253 RepID=A0A0K2GH26_NITMO|nr:YtxH domain-containing protein [Nitrospira moscoviensis]ALA60268.1 hypothetical protein NITMOv2_3881 [Nitrospira moscoviensis]
MNDKSIFYGGLGFVAGLVVGAGVGLVTAPHSGARTRRHLKVFAEDVKERIAELSQEARDMTHRVAERGKRLVA